MKKFLIVLALIVFAVITYLASEGLFRDAEISERLMPGYRVMGLTHTGPYEKIGDAYKRVGEVAAEQGIAAHMIGVYYDNPDEVPKDSLRALAGLIVSSGDSLKLAALPEFSALAIPKGNAVVATFETDGMVSMIIGAMKCYPALTTYVGNSDKAAQISYVYEVYEEGYTNYVMQFE